MHFEADTKELHETGSEIKKIALEIEALNTFILKRISSITSESIWIGESATKFIDKVNSDFTEYNKLTEVINNYGQFYIDSADKIEKAVRRIQ